MHQTTIRSLSLTTVLALACGPAFAQSDRAGALRQELLRARAAHSALEARVQDLLRLVEARAARSSKSSKSQSTQRLLQTRIDRYAKRVSALERELTKTRVDLERQRRAVAASSEKLSAHDALTKSLVKARTDLSALRGQLTAQNKRYGKLAQDREALMAQMKRDVSKSQKLRSEQLQLAQSQLAKKNAELRSVASRYRSMQKRLDGQQRTMREMSKKYSDALRSRQASAGRDVERKMKALVSEASKLKRQLSARDATIRSMRKQMAQLTTDRAARARNAVPSAVMPRMPIPSRTAPRTTRTASKPRAGTTRAVRQPASKSRWSSPRRRRPPR